MIASCQIVDDESKLVSNHRPKTCSFTVPISNSSNTCNRTPLSYHVTWSKVSRDLKSLYTYSLQNDVGLDAALSLSITCSTEVDALYDMLVTSLPNTVKQVIPKRQFKCHLKPYWTNELTRLNKSMKEVRIEWLHHGCPRHGNIFTRLKQPNVCSATYTGKRLNFILSVYTMK